MLCSTCNLAYYPSPIDMSYTQISMLDALNNQAVIQEVNVDYGSKNVLLLVNFFDNHKNSIYKFQEGDKFIATLNGNNMNIINMQVTMNTLDLNL